ncbi:MAG: phosphate ABC transporter substrate-binding/OmpA family protein [Hyphomicrobiaceae bacterium]
MREKLRAYVRLVALAGSVALLPPTAASSAEIQLSLRGGGGFQIKGELQSFDGRKYIIINPSFGRMEVDARRFECVGSTCPTAPVRANLSPGPVFNPARPAQISIAGSNTVGNQLMPAIIKAYAQKMNLRVEQVSQPSPLDLIFHFKDANGREVAKIDLARHGSSTSFRGLQSGQAQIGMSSRPIKDAEVASLAALGNMRAVTHEHILGLDGLLILVSPSNPLISISISDVAKVFSGEITDWSQLGFEGGKINIYAPDEVSGTWETFQTLVLKPKNLTLVASAKRTQNHAEQADWVAADPLGIGFVGMAYLRNAKPLNIEATCGLITPPTNFSIKTEEYPFSRRLYLYTPGRPEQTLAGGLLDFALSQEAQSIVSKADFIDQAPEMISFADQGSRVAYALNAPEQDFNLELMRAFLTELKEADRLTYTFRFNTGAVTLDAKSVQDTKKLVDLMAGKDLKDKAIKLIGFADSGGAFENNLSLSLSRARAVRAALLKAGEGRINPSQVLVRGYGELAPVACNNSLESKAFNRRVEVWVDRNQ